VNKLGLCAWLSSGAFRSQKITIIGVGLSKNWEGTKFEGRKVVITDESMSVGPSIKYVTLEGGWGPRGCDNL